MSRVLEEFDKLRSIVEDTYARQIRQYQQAIDYCVDTIEGLEDGPAKESYKERRKILYSMLGHLEHNAKDALSSIDNRRIYFEYAAQDDERNHANP